MTNKKKQGKKSNKNHQDKPWEAPKIAPWKTPNSLGRIRAQKAAQRTGRTQGKGGR